MLTLTAANSPPIICGPRAAADLSVLCGSASEWAPQSTRYRATLKVVLRIGGEHVAATAHGWFVRGLSPDGWAGARWIGLSDANDTRAQYRSEVDLRSAGFQSSSDVAHAMLFVARPSANPRLGL